MNSEDNKEKPDESKPPDTTKDKVKDTSLDVQEIFKDAPPEIQKEITRMAMMFRSGPMPPPVHPLFNKFTAEHIDKFLDYNHKDDDNNYKLEKSNKTFNLIYALLGVGLLIFMIVYLVKDNADLLAEILKILVIFAGGFGGGFGFKSYLEKKKK